MSGLRLELRWMGAAFALAMLTTSQSAGAQPSAPMPRPWPPGVTPVTIAPHVAFNTSGRSLRERLGVEVARQLLVSDDPKERMRGVDRLGTLGDAPAIDALLEAIDSGAPGLRDAETRTHAIRMLASHAGETRIRAFLARELLGGAGGRVSLVRSTAAMALALEGDQKALETLALALDQRGPASDAARIALLAYPPRTLDPFLFEPEDESSDDDAHGSGPHDDQDELLRVMQGRQDAEAAKKRPKHDKSTAAPDDDDNDDTDKPTPKKEHTRRARTLSAPMIDFFAELGDLRALPALRKAQTRKQVVVKAHAGLALAKFGDPTGLADAREATKGDDPRVMGVATETLVVLGDADATAALTKLLDAQGTQSLALDLLFGAGRPALFKSLHKKLETLSKDADGRERSRLVMALGRIGPDHVAALLDGPAETREVAAYALAIAPGADGTSILEKRIARAKPGDDKRLLVRAAIVRAVVLGEATTGLDDLLDSLLASKSDADRETGAFGLVATGTSAATVLGRSGDKSDVSKKVPSPSVVAGAARGALLGRTEDLSAFEPLLIQSDKREVDDEHPTLTQIAAGVALLDAKSAAEVPQTKLIAWAEGGGPLAPLAARALGARDDETIRSRIEGLLHGTDPIIRASVAVGLGSDPEPSSVSLLVDAYLNESDANVRKACIRALGVRSEVQRKRVLEWASALDPDDGVRTAARLALQGRGLREGDAPIASTVSFTHVTRADGGAPMTAARFVGPDGVAIPVVSAADGVLMLPTAAFGSGALTVSPDAAPITQAKKP